MNKTIKNKSNPLKWRMFFRSNEKIKSPIHDIKLYPHNSTKSIVNMVVEIPRGTQAKMEMATKEKHNPIKQDVKDGKLRFVHYPYPFSYGALPQTWEDPKHKDSRTHAFGDGDPIDACEIGSGNYKIGDVIKVKILGVWAMIDDGQTDWKVICICVNDPLADKINNLKDIDKHLPGVLDYYYQFLRNYKIPAGSKPNKFAFRGKPQSKEFAKKIVHETHNQWKDAISGKREVTKDELAF